MTIEQAISQMEYNRHILGLPYQGDTWRPNANTIACDLALEALREKQERDKGCEYCLQGEDLAYGLDSMQRTGRIYIDGNLLTADLYSESMAVAVCCCPMCGRQLKDEPMCDGR